MSISATEVKQNGVLIFEKMLDKFSEAWNTTQVKPTQLFSYVQQVRTIQFIALYASDFIDNKVVSDCYLINATDNETLLKTNQLLENFLKKNQ